MAYAEQFYADMRIGSRQSAEELVPLVYRTLKPKSVLDVGCGTGAWIDVWQKYGVDVYGVDGGWVNLDLLEVSKDKFENVDLERPFDVGKKFDLVMTLEVAEHIHEDKKDIFLNSLTRHSDIILFSAAIPWQGGTDHFNEQWPSYWIADFKQRGYTFLDPFRHLIWTNDRIKTHYKQNTVLFVKDDLVATDAFFQNELSHTSRSVVNIVHPDQFVRVRDPGRVSLRKELLRTLSLCFSYFKKNLNR